MLNRHGHFMANFRLWRPPQLFVEFFGRYRGTKDDEYMFERTPLFDNYTNNFGCPLEAIEEKKCQQELLFLKTTAVFVVFAFHCYTIGCFGICKKDYEAFDPENW